jgi:two-component system, chemotaxis family, CheB/CheR fusion protein
LHVLIVEDHAQTARMLADCLEADGHAVRTAADGPAALAAAAEEPPDVALIDLTLPGIDGYAVARALHGLRPDRRPLLVVMTDRTERELRDRSRAEGIDLHLVKPVAPEAINGLLRRFGEILCPPEVYEVTA